LFPQIAACADDLTIVRSMTTKVNEHAQGNYAFHTGFPFMGHPSAGAWISYGMGSGNRDLPSFVVLQSGEATTPHGGVGVFSSGYLPAQHQASILKADAGAPLAFITPAESDQRQRASLGFINALDTDFLREAPDARVAAAIANYETAYRMQTSVPELCELKGEPDSIKKLYGLDSPDKYTAAYARQALTARRLVERGVRFVQVWSGTGGPTGNWDNHANMAKELPPMCASTDLPIAGLLQDLRSCGLLEDTLVLWNTEFGRMPFAQSSEGRDHNGGTFVGWMAGAGVRPGVSYGQSDEWSWKAARDITTTYDFHATALHLLGLNHERLNVLHQGANRRLTDVHGEVIRAVLA
jgi:uncharacterized protein (DUF1501 family)